MGEGETIFNNDGTVIVKNSIFDNLYDNETNCFGTPITDSGGNLHWPETDSSCGGQPGDPKLSSLDYHGGITQTLALQPGSAAINTGLNSVCAASPVSNTSQNGILRPHGPRCDIGAFELNYPVVKSILRLDSNPTTAEDVRFSVSFSTPVTGVDVGDFRLTIEDLNGAYIREVNGSGADYTVSVFTGLNSGTIRLDLIDDDSIKTMDGTLLGLSGTRNGNYNSGEMYTIDRIPPSVKSIVLANPNPNNSDLVAFKITFSEPVINVDRDDFLHVSQGLSGVNVTNVSGSGAEYTITIDTGTGSGTLGLNLIDNDTILDLAQNFLGGQGTGNGDFANGAIYAIKEGPIFEDTPNDWSLPWIERLYQAGLTNGCNQSPLLYCPFNEVTRAEMAKFILTAKHGPSFKPQEATGVFSDIDYDNNEPWYVDWVDELYREGLTDGCSPNTLSYCPDASVSRAEMAKFILKALNGKDYNLEPLQPGEDTGFADVNPEFWAAPWIKELKQQGLTDGDGTGNYNPFAPVTRKEMAKFIVTAFDYP